METSTVTSDDSHELKSNNNLLPFPKNRPLPPIPLPECPRPKMVRPMGDTERPRGCLDRLFRKIPQPPVEDWPQLNFLRRTMSLPKNLHLPEDWPYQKIWKTPFLSFSQPILPSMETEDSQPQLDNIQDLNISCNAGDYEDNDMDDDEDDDQLLPCISLPCEIDLYDEHPRRIRWVPPGLSRSLPDIHYLSDKPPAFRRRLHLWEIFKLDCRVLCRVCLPFLPKSWSNIPDDDVYYEALDYIEEELERQKSLKQMEKRLIQMEKLAADQFAINLQKNYRRTIRLLATTAAKSEEQRKAEAVILMAILRHVHEFRSNFKSSK